MTGLTMHEQRLIFNKMMMMMMRWKNDFVIFVNFMSNEAQPIAFKFRESD